MKKFQFAAAVLFIAICCAPRFADDEISKSQQFLATFGDQKAGGRLKATADGAIFELFDNGNPQTSRGSLALDEAGVSSLTLNDGHGRARFHVSTDKKGATTLAITNGRGQTVWGIDVDADGHVKVTSKATITPADRR
jgi:hypothetical protein